MSCRSGHHSAVDMIQPDVGKVHLSAAGQRVCKHLQTMQLVVEVELLGDVLHLLAALSHSTEAQTVASCSSSQHVISRSMHQGRPVRHLLLQLQHRTLKVQRIFFELRLQVSQSSVMSSLAQHDTVNMAVDGCGKDDFRTAWQMFELCKSFPLIGTQFTMPNLHSATSMRLSLKRHVHKPMLARAP